MEILKFFFQPSCCKQNDYSKLENVDEDIHTKFLLNYSKQLNTLIDATDYDAVYDKFEQLLRQYKSANKINESISLVKRSVISEADDNKKAFKKKLKKRSAYNANITVINEEEEMGQVVSSKDHFFFKSDEIVTGNIKSIKKSKLLKQASFDVTDLSMLNKTPARPKKKHRPSKSVEMADIDDEKTQYLDAESTMHLSALKSTKKKRKSGSKKTKKKRKTGEKNTEMSTVASSISMFQPDGADLKSENIKFVKVDSEAPFDLKKVPKKESKKVNMNKTAVPDLVKSKTRVSLSTIDNKKPANSKIVKLKSLFENMAKKTKEKIKVELDPGKKKIPRVSDPKGLDKRKSRLSAGKLKTKRKSAKGMKTFIAENLGIKKEKLEKLNEIKNSIIQKQATTAKSVTSKTTTGTAKTPHKTGLNAKKLDLLASKCVTLKKLDSTVPKNLNTTIGGSKPATKNFIEINKQKMRDAANKRALNTTVGSSANKSLFYPSQNESTTNVYKALNDFAVEQLKNQRLAKDTMKLNETRKGLDNMVTKKKPMLKNLPRYGSTSTISTHSSLDSNTSILSTTSSLNDSAFKSASSKFTSMNSTMSSIMTNDKSYGSMNQSKLNGSLYKGHIPKQITKPNVTVTVTSSKTPKKIDLAKPVQKQLLQLPESKYGNQLKPIGEITKPLISKIPSANAKKNSDYNINDLNSEDETDDEDEPNKPIPAWADWKLITERVINQNRATINFTKLFSAAADENVDLCSIFTIQRNRFKARTSSAHWPQPAVWKSEGITGDESFRNQ